MMRWPVMTAWLLATAGVLYAQSPAPSASTLQTTTRLVIVPTLVQTPSKETVYSLQAKDFQLTDRGIPQKINLDDENHQPLSLVVLMQTGGAAVHEFDKYRNLEPMLADMLGRAPNQVSIVNFDSKPEAASPFTSDIAQWTDAINHPDPGDNGAAIMDGLKYALSLLAKQPTANRRVILLISQPTDSGSKTTAKEILQISGETNTAIYTLTFSPQMTRLKNDLKEGGHSHPPVHLATGDYVAYFDLGEPLGMILGAMRKNVAAEVASLSGGEAAGFENQHDLDEGLASISNHLRNRYTLSFVPSSSEPGLHPIQVRLPDYPGLIVSARSNYWLSDQSSSSQ
ncbi:MAG TPA: VWA domain-containing protein [Edaphobacter sp.]|nr:VWA domain-containing protein [Edaphobacter sp.]